MRAFSRVKDCIIMFNESDQYLLQEVENVNEQLKPLYTPMCTYYILAYCPFFVLLLFTLVVRSMTIIIIIMKSRLIFILQREFL